jgi:hypothetical protein
VYSNSASTFIIFFLNFKPLAINSSSIFFLVLLSDILFLVAIKNGSEIKAIGTLLTCFNSLNK